MRKHLVLGAGGIGRGIAERLAQAGDEVVLAARSPIVGPPPGVRTAQVDATDPEAVSRLAAGVDVLVNAMNPANYSTWARDWPPMAAAALAAAERVGAGLVTVSNLYAYGRVDAPMTPASPIRPNGVKGQVRAQMWAAALAAHEAGRVRACELRPSDYFGPGARPATSYLNRYVLGPALKGRAVRLVMGDPDAAHTWTYLDDIAALGATLARDDRAWGRAWHVPSAPPRSVREVVADVSVLTGRDPVPVGLLPAVVRRLARVAPIVRELDETAHQFERPYILDASSTTETFALEPTPWPDSLAATCRALAPAALPSRTNSEARGWRGQ